jgi:CBS domain-containing protein
VDSEEAVMRSVAVRDVMTTSVFSVREATPVKYVAELMAGRRVSALPVAADDRLVVGVVSEADLLRKRIGRPVGWLARAAWRRRAAGRVAADLMTSPAFTVSADASITDAARRMVRHGVKRLPVVDRYGKLVGIVSRADLVRAFTRTDDDLREEIEHEVFERALRLPPGILRAEVFDGVVTLTGELARRSLIPITVSLVRQLAGVVGVEERLTFASDDTGVTPDLGQRR